MGILDLPPNFHWVEATRNEEIFIHAAFGFVLGFGILTARSAWKQTSLMRNPWKSKFAWLVWLELVINGIASTFNLLGLNKTIKPGFGMFFGMTILWGALTITMLLILCNRVAIIETSRRKAKQITWGVFGIWMFMWISMLVMWTPAKMQINPTWVKVNFVWNRVEKVTYLIIDVALNTYFIRTVQKKLVSNGIVKYARIVRFNVKLICISIAMDIVLIGLMSLPQPVAYMEQVGVTCMVKLNIELSLAQLLLIIAREPNVEAALNIGAHERVATKDAFTSRPSFSHPDTYRMSLSRPCAMSTNASCVTRTRMDNMDGNESDMSKDITVIVAVDQEESRAVPPPHSRSL